ncbi:MAG: 30S ribosomal protein S16 [Victivallaceae bacterium]|nr:30S ribosomal protein S16 [Victivallaceae bacterium]
MAVTIRLKRIGTRNASCFRMVVMDKRMARDGRAIEEIGFYNPHSKEERVNLERADYWMGVGAQVSENCEHIIDRVRKGIDRRGIVKPAKPSKKQVAKLAAEAKAKAEAEAKAAEEAAAAKAAAEAAAAEAAAPAETAAPAEA